MIPIKRISISKCVNPVDVFFKSDSNLCVRYFESKSS